jgi:hypothetical protein
MKKTLYTDKAGNSLVRESDGSVSVKNRKGSRVTGSEFDKFIKQNPKAKRSLFD